MFAAIKVLDQWLWLWRRLLQFGVGVWRRFWRFPGMSTLFFVWCWVGLPLMWWWGAPALWLPILWVALRRVQSVWLGMLLMWWSVQIFALATNVYEKWFFLFLLWIIVCGRLRMWSLLLAQIRGSKRP